MPVGGCCCGGGGGGGSGSGSYAPAFTNVDPTLGGMVASVNWGWMRVGKLVHVRGAFAFNIGTPSAGGQTFDVSLPFAAALVRECDVLVLNQSTASAGLAYDMEGVGALQTATTVRITCDRFAFPTTNAYVARFACMFEVP